MYTESSGNQLLRNYIRISHSILLCALLVQLSKPLYGQAVSRDLCSPTRSQRTINTGDLVHLLVVGMPELEQRIRVSNSGDVELFFVGRVHVLGKTLQAASVSISEALQNGGFVRGAQVDTLLERFGYEYVSVRGEVLHPGSYRLTQETDLLEIISLAGGLGQFASTEITIRSQGNPGEVICAVVGNETNEKSTDRVMVSPGDTIVVNRAATAYVLGDVKHPGGILLPIGGMTASRAIASASNFDSLKRSQQVRLVKLTPTGPVESVLDLHAIDKGKQSDPLLSPEDIIYVSSAEHGNVFPDVGAIVASARSTRVKGVLGDQGSQ